MLSTVEIGKISLNMLPENLTVLLPHGLDSVQQVLSGGAIVGSDRQLIYVCVYVLYNSQANSIVSYYSS